MRCTELSLPGVWRVEIEPSCDERGFFARTFCAEEFAQIGLPSTYCQSSVSFNQKRGTLRGMHFQANPSKESKLVRCIRGAILDVVLDLREGSESFGRSVGVELSDDNRTALAIPAGCAHGFITLKDESEVLYMMSEPFNPSLSRGVRWDDPRFSISWPFSPLVISERDAQYPDFSSDIL